MVAQEASILLVSDLPDDFVRSLYLEPYTDLDAAMARAFEICGTAAKVLVMPYAGSTLPQVGKAN